MGTHYIDYEPRSATAKRRGILRITAVASSILLTGGYVLYRTRAATPTPAVSRVMPLSRVAPLPGGMRARLTATQPTTRHTREQLLLMSSSKSGAIVPPPQSPPVLAGGIDTTEVFLMPGGPATQPTATTQPTTQP